MDMSEKPWELDCFVLTEVVEDIMRFMVLLTLEPTFHMSPYPGMILEIHTSRIRKMKRHRVLGSQVGQSFDTE